MIAVCAPILVFPLSQAAAACLCKVMTAESAFYGANVVFVGKVIRVKTAKEASVSLIVKRSGAAEMLKTPVWEKSLGSVRIATLEVSDAFKGVTDKTIEVSTSVYDGGGTCGVNFKVGETYLVYAYNRMPELTADQAKLPRATRTKEIQFKAAADKFNEHLPLLETGICSRTRQTRWAQEDLDTIHSILKTIH